METKDPFSYPDKVAISFPELGIVYFRLIMRKGFKKEFPEQVGGVKKSNNVTMVPVGLIRTWNPNREGYLDVPGRPGRIYGGLLLPGAYTLEALEDSIYACVAITQNAGEQHIPEDRMFELEQYSAKRWTPITLSWEAGYRAVICAFGHVKVGDQSLQDGDSYTLQEGETIEVMAEIPSELVAYKLKEV